MNVDVYRNLHKDTWSVRDRSTGLVVDHQDHVMIKDAQFIVQPAGRARVLREQKKNVHAFVRGVVEALPRVTTFDTPCDVQVKYNPYKADHFYEAETGEAVSEAPIVVLDTQGAWIQKNVSTGQSEVLESGKETA